MEVNMMKTLVTLLAMAALVLSVDQARAGKIVVANVMPGPGFPQKTVVLSDLKVFTTNPFVPFVEILKSRDNTDDVTLKNLEFFSREILQDIDGFEISETINGKEIKSGYLGLRTRTENKPIERRVSFLSDPADNPLFLTVNDALLLDAPPEGSFFSFTNGVDASRPDWFASTLDPSTGMVLGPYSGSAEVVSTRFVVTVDVPEPSTLALIALGPAGLGVSQRSRSTGSGLAITHSA
jgi:hypothetical protein